MARRASKSSHPFLIIGLIAAVGIIAAVGTLIFRKPTAGFANVAPLDVREFLENGNSFRGNEYVVEGVIDEKLRWTPNRGQVVSMRVDGSDDMIGIEIPPEFNDLNVEREQRYAIRVKIREGGIPVATGLSRL